MKNWENLWGAVGGNEKSRRHFWGGYPLDFIKESQAREKLASTEADLFNYLLMPMPTITERFFAANYFFLWSERQAFDFKREYFF